MDEIEHLKARVTRLEQETFGRLLPAGYMYRFTSDERAQLVGIEVVSPGGKATRIALTE